MNSKLYLPLWILALLTATALSPRVNPLAYTGGRARDDEQRARRNSSALANMFGEFRTSISDIMFIKTERYLHAGVGYTPHMPAMSAEDLAAEVDEHQSELGMPDEDHHHHHHHDHDHDDHHRGTPTLIPTEQKDFRGFVGRLHREVKPWRHPDRAHVHTDGRELLPWFRIMTLSDPGYVRGYVAGSFWLQSEDTELAIAFIEEGLRHNPDEFQLYVSRGFLRLRLARRQADITVPAHEMDPAARALVEQAREDFLRGADLMLGVRPDPADQEALDAPDWGSYLESDAMAAAFMSVTLTRNLGDPEGAVALARRFAPYFPEHDRLRAAAQGLVLP